MKKIIIIGASGYAKVIAETIDLLDQVQVVGFIDDHIEKGTFVYERLQVIGSVNEIQQLSIQCDAFVIGIGNNEIRKQIASQYSGKIQFETIIHPSAYVSKSAFLSEGAVILAGSVINSNSKIGKHSIINSNAVVDHDCQVGEFVHLVIGTLVGSNSIVSGSIKTDIGQVIPAFSTI
jgi:acetyltransferase EpsM